MAVVFSDEIEAILRAGPPRIDWEAISAELKAEFLAGPGQPSNIALDGDGDEGFSVDARCSSLFNPLIELQTSPDTPLVNRCPMWSCLHARRYMASLYADRPVVTGSLQTVEDFRHMNAPWITFSAESVKELNRMGIDCVVTAVRARRKKLTGAVVYRGSSDSEAIVKLFASNVLASLAGTVTYLTAHADDNTLLAESFMHMFSNGGRVCGYASRDSTCGICDDTGLVVGELYGAPSDVVDALPYCVCSAGARREARDDEDREYEAGAFIMGRYDGGLSEVGAHDRWVDDEIEFERGNCSEPPGTPKLVGISLEHLEIADTVSSGSVHGGTRPRFGPAAGLCYLDMVKRDALDEATARLDEWPKVKDILLSPDTLFDVEKMSTLSFEQWDNTSGSSEDLPAGRLLHVVPLSVDRGSQGSLCDILRAVCRDSGLVYGRSTLACALFAGDVTEFGHGGVGLFDRVGGPADSSQEVYSMLGSFESLSSPSSSMDVTTRRVASPGVAGAYKCVVNPDGTASAQFVAGGSAKTGSGGGSKGKMLCNVCGCLVNPVGHADRCSPPVVRTGSKFTVEAWLGDAIHALDIRAVLAEKDLEPVERHNAYTSLVEAPAQAKYYMMLDDKPEEIVMQNGVVPNDHTIASVFEKYYVGEFRDRYLAETFGIDAAAVDRLICSLMGDVSVPRAPRLDSLRRRVVVMPPRHGKTELHGVGKLKDADAVCDVGANPTLKALRLLGGSEPARSHAYVAEWVSVLVSGTGARDVLMVSSVELARATGFELVGVFLLEEKVWLARCKSASFDQLKAYKVCYRSALASGASGIGAHMFSTMSALRAKLNEVL